jgi:EAL domain-containing protein (putative c-di-GMP-specific phosphodiesterase class I)
VQLRSHTLVGMAAARALEASRAGFMAPSQLIPLAEETGLIIPIGEWVLREACRQNRAWQDADVTPPRTPTTRRS